MYDIIFIGDKKLKSWDSLKSKFPTAKQADTFEIASKKSLTKMFWAVYPDLNLVDDWDFSYQADDYSLEYIHMFSNGNFKDGIALHPKNHTPSKKEIEYRFYFNKKIIEIKASVPKKFDIFTIDTYADYLDAIEKTTTEMFWGVPSDIDVCSDFDFSFYIPHESTDRNSNHSWLNGNKFDGINLFSKKSPVVEKEISYRFLTNKIEHKTVASNPKPFEQFTIDSYEDYITAKKESKTDMFWGIPSDVDISKDFKFDKTFDNLDTLRNTNHVFLNNTSYDGVVLFSKTLTVSEKEIQHRFYVNKKEWEVVASTPKPYQIFDIETYEEYLAAMDQATGDLFWMSSPNIKIDKDFNFYVSYHEQSDRKQTHAFKHCNDLYNGLFLCSKHQPLSKKEVEYRFPVNRIEHDIVATGPCKYDSFIIETYEDYKTALETTTTEMFWMLSNNLKIDKDFKLDLYFTHDNEYDRKQNHAFIHKVGDKELRNGIFLCSKHQPLTEKEVNYRFPVNRKEWDIVASGMTEYDTFYIHDYKDYCNALEKCNTEMFWIIFNNVDASDFKRDLYFSHDNEYDRKQNHTFIHKDNDVESRNGVWLCSKAVPISKKEIEYRFVVNAKEHNVIASKPKLYPIFDIKTYDDYCEVFEKCEQEMFWGIPNNVNVTDKSIFKTYYPYKHLYDEEHLFDRKINHLYKNGKYQDGIMLCSKHCKISKREWDYGFIVNKKEVNVVASQPKPYDIVFISYQEENADENYNNLCKKYPNVKRVHGVKGIHNAHIAAAQKVDTEMFWVVDGDAELVENFELDFQVPKWEHDVVHVWRSQNPINGLVYGYGGVKLLPTQLTINMNTASADMTTSISDKFKAVEETSNITKFNTDEFNSWKSGFRECVKLARWCKQSRHYRNEAHKESEDRLEVWCNEGIDKLYGSYCIAGANAGRAYGEKHWKDDNAIGKINDFVWLQNKFKKQFDGKL